MKVKRVEKHGTEVFSNTKMDKLRKTECLCLNCANVEDCPISEDLHTTCIYGDVAIMITRCPDFERRL